MICAGQPPGRPGSSGTPSRRYARIAINQPRVVRYILLSSPPPPIAEDRRATEPASASGRKRRSLGRHRCQDLSYGEVACVAGLPCPLPATGLHLGRLAPKQQEETQYSYAE